MKGSCFWKLLVGICLLTACGGAEVSESAAVASTGGAVGADLVLVTVDTLRADVLGFAGHPDTRTPVLDRLAAAGRFFPRAHAHNVVTLPSHANILTGRYPYEHGVRENSGFVLGPEARTLAEILAEAGYATGAFIGAYPLDSRFGLDQGFEHYDDRYPKGSSPEKFQFAERRGSEVVASALAWWRSQEGRPRFLWVHLYDPHAPYDPPQDIGFSDRPYLGEIASTDSALSELLDPLIAPSAKPTVVVFTADHGEALGDHGEVTHGLFTYEATLRVPLVLAGPGIVAGRDDRLAGHVDIVPTVLELLEVEPPPGLSGLSLVGAEDRDRSIYFEAVSTYLNRGWAPLRGLLSGSWKMVSLPLPELYDLKTDPGEQKNLSDLERSTFRRLHARLPKESWPPVERTVEPEEAARLRQLGYLTSSPATGKRSFSAADDPKTLIDLDRSLHHFIDAYSRGQLEDAVTIASQIVAQRPEMAMGYEHLALALRELGRGSDAARVLELAVEKGIAGSSLLRQLGLTLAEIGRAEEAVTLLLPLSETGDPATLNALGIALTDAGRHQEAIEHLERALRLDEESPKVLENLGVANLRLQRPQMAREHLERALELNPDLPISWNVLGVALSMQGDSRGAIEAWKKSVAIEPGQLQALFNLGMTAARIGDRETARSALERFVTASGSPADVAKARQVLQSLSGTGP